MATVPVISGGYICTLILNPDRFSPFFTGLIKESERFHKDGSLIGNSAPLPTPSSPSAGQISSISKGLQTRDHSLEPLYAFRTQCNRVFYKDIVVYVRG
jgi:hypothetical protein